MKKLESSLKNMALALTGFSVVAGGLLGWVNDVTAEPIAQANAKTLSDAIAVVVPGFDNNPAEAPEIAVAVIVENAGFGAAHAAPIARRVFDYWLLGDYPSEEDIAAVRKGQASAPLGKPRKAADIVLPTP